MDTHIRGVKVKQYILPEQLGQAILNYLAKKPYEETHQLIQGLQQIKEMPPKDQPQEKEVREGE